ncbi:hypothetical protein A2U04_05220 [Fusobacterium necrophorum subsp. funduliforme]|uniref:hypothetical protein n=1 Tax=Fusobacterium necrophorum TaxID=859 RepID=UPI000786CEC4|nr:hypothetical protein [Fusobacterium necrophorum]KYM48128.1 hypothetical protein A2U04_05220 [Fusobacterium necrophorum subsp. funduliforme]
MSKDELKKLKTWNGKAIHTDDVRKVFSILKALLKLWGHKSYIVFGDTPPAKDKCIEMIHQLFDEYADNKYMATVERKFQLEEHTCSCAQKDKMIETLQKDNEYLFAENVELYIRAGKKYTREICLWGIATVGWGLLGVALACLWWR